MRDLNAPPETIQALEAQQEKASQVIFPENWNIWQAFLKVSTQWSRGPSGAVDALDYQRVEAGLRLAGIELTPEDFEQLRVIETAVIDWVRKQQ